MRTCNYSFIIAMVGMSYQEMHDSTKVRECSYLKIFPIVIRKLS